LITLRCTQKLLKALKQKPEADPPAPSSPLGDWCAKPLHVNQRPYVLAASQKTLMMVLLPRKGDMPATFRARVLALLRRWEAPQDAIDREAFHLQEIRYGTTNNRSVLGALNQAVPVAQDMMEEGSSEESVEDFLARFQCSAARSHYAFSALAETLGYTTPDPFARRSSIELMLSQRDRTLLTKHTLAPDALLKPILAADPKAMRVTLKIDVEDVDDLLGYIAKAEKAHPQLEQELGELRSRLEEAEAVAYDAIANSLARLLGR
jgi:hypothetical protein